MPDKMSETSAVVLMLLALSLKFDSAAPLRPLGDVEKTAREAEQTFNSVEKSGLLTHPAPLDPLQGEHGNWRKALHPAPVDPATTDQSRKTTVTPLYPLGNVDHQIRNTDATTTPTIQLWSTESTGQPTMISPAETKPVAVVKGAYQRSDEGIVPCTSRPLLATSLVSHCMIAIVALVGLATIFIVSTIILCTKLSSTKYKYRITEERSTEMMCITDVLPDGN